MAARPSNILSIFCQFPDIESRLKKHNFYDNNRLEELVASIHSVQETETANGFTNKVASHFIYDSDGYCNLRKRAASARIIGRIPSDVLSSCFRRQTASGGRFLQTTARLAMCTKAEL